jgi:hypothetical protein
VQETNVFKGSQKFNLGDPDKWRGDLLGRKTSYCMGGSLRRCERHQKECESVLEKIKTQGYRTDTREIAYHIARLSYETGGRITALLKLKVSEIAVTEQTVTFLNDKGGLDRTVPIS